MEPQTALGRAVFIRTCTPPRRACCRSCPVRRTEEPNSCELSSALGLEKQTWGKPEEGVFQSVFCFAFSNMAVEAGVLVVTTTRKPVDVFCLASSWAPGYGKHVHTSFPKLTMQPKYSNRRGSLEVASFQRCFQLLILRSTRFILRTSFSEPHFMKD